MKLVLLGGPGAGKGTQAALLKDHFGIVHLSTGEVLREARAAGTELGRKAAEYMDAGRLLPDDIILGIVREKLALPEMEKGFLLDGFPRTIPQAEGLEEMLVDIKKPLDAVVSIEVPDEVVIDRLLKRAEIEGRSDDNRETIKKRLDVYYQQTAPLKAFYEKRSILKTVDGVGTVEEIFNRVKIVLEP
ncbi:adenylate kinase [Candidatus Latescibacterota bacterium]